MFALFARSFFAPGCSLSVAEWSPSVLAFAPPLGSLEVLVRDDRREWGSAEDEATVAGQSVDRGGRQRLQLCFPAPCLDFVARDLIPFEHHDSRDGQSRFSCDLRGEFLLPALVGFVYCLVCLGHSWLLSYLHELSLAVFSRAQTAPLLIFNVSHLVWARLAV